MRYPDFIENPYPFPPFHAVTPRLSGERLPEPAAAVAAQVRAALPESGIKPDDTVAVAVGSRGIDQGPAMVAALCRELSAAGAKPFLMPAMGSHGGATAEGQVRVLAGLGITEATCGAPVISSMAARRIATAKGEIPVVFAEDALRADHSVCLNRIKPHTKFKAPVESGLYKMLCVGMGKHEGALSYHRWALKYGFAETLTAMGDEALRHANFRFGVAVVENGHDRVCHVEAVPASRLAEREPALLDLANRHFPRLPFPEADVLVVGRIGKEISGAGMDPNVTGRAVDLGESDFSGCFRATRVVILDLSEKTGGNAIGLGLADIVTEKVFRNMDYEATLMNALTSGSLHKAFIPIRMPTEEKAIQAGFTTLGPVEPQAVRAVIVRDTRHLDRFLVTPSLLPALSGQDGIEIGPPEPLVFDSTGDLIRERI